jgi:hypothetical protein
MMAKLEGLTLSADETVKTANVSDPQKYTTLKNDDAAKTLWYKFHPQQDETTDGENAAALRTDLWGELKAGEAVVFTGITKLYYTVASGDTSLTARLIPGMITEASNVVVTTTIGTVQLENASDSENIDPAKEDGNLATLATAVGTNLTFSSVAVTANNARQNIAYQAAKVARLHKHVGTMSTAGTIGIETANDAAGAGAIVLATAFELDDLAGFVDPFCADPNGVLATSAAGKYLNLVVGTGHFKGYAIISYADA